LDHKLSGQKDQRLKKSELLRSRKLINSLFQNGYAFFHYPIQVVVIRKTYDADIPVSILFSVSKRKFKKAVDRNQLKRLMREAYRKNKTGLWNFLSKENYSLMIAFIYTGSKVMTYAQIENKVIDIQDHLMSLDVKEIPLSEE
jgi:ribonuclease P protein component